MSVRIKIAIGSRQDNADSNGPTRSGVGRELSQIWINAETEIATSNANDDIT